MCCTFAYLLAGSAVRSGTVARVLRMKNKNQKIYLNVATYIDFEMVAAKVNKIARSCYGLNYMTSISIFLC